jgi:HSP20 family protein
MQPINKGGVMSLIRYEAGPITTLFDELDSLISGGFDWTGRELTGTLYPHVDITESEAEYMIKADLPGLTKEDIKVSVEDGVLSISGEKKREVEKKEKNRYYHFERSYGRFTRSFTLPGHVDGKNIEAKYANGVLEVHLKKTGESKPKEIEVKVA